MLTRSVSLLAVLGLPLLACGTDDEEEVIRSLSASWLSYAQSRDAASIAELYGPDGVVLEAGRDPVVGPRAIEAEIEADWAVNPDFTVDWAPARISVARSGDVAWERGRWTFDADGPGPARTRQGEYVTIYEKVDGSWKVAVDIGLSTDPSGF